MPLDNYTCITLQNCSIKNFSEYVKQVDNLGRLAVTESHIDCNTKLRIIANRIIEIAFNVGYNI